MKKKNKNALLFFGLCFIAGSAAVGFAFYTLTAEYLLLNKYNTVIPEVIKVERNTSTINNTRCQDDKGDYNYYVEVLFENTNNTETVRNITNRGGGNICKSYNVGDSVELYYHEWNKGLLLYEKPEFDFKYILPGLLFGFIGLPFFFLGLIFPFGLYAEIRDWIKGESD